MERSLRKGFSYVDLQYPGIVDSMRADTFTVSQDGNAAIISFRVRPAGRNQKEDERNLHEKELISVTIDDDYMIKNLKTILDHNPCSSMILNILSMGRLLTFRVHPDQSNHERLHMAVYD